MRRCGALVAAVVVLTGMLAVAGSPASAGPSVDVAAFGPAPALGAPDIALNGRIVDLAPHPSRNGYWLLGRDGGVFSYGVPFYGSTGSLRLNAPVTGMVPTPTGRGYWFTASDGGVFAFGDATFHGSTGHLALAAPVVGMAATPTGRGYWLAAADGGVFAFGDARFHGSGVGTVPAPVVAIAPAPAGGGYLLLTAAGSLHSFGSVPAFAQVAIPQGALDVAVTRSGRGAWVVATNGAVYTFGDAPYHGGAHDRGRIGRAIGAAAGGGYWLALTPRDAPGPPVPLGSGTGRRVVYSNSMQRVWLVEADETVSYTFLVSGKQGVPAPGTYAVFSKSVMSSANNGSLRLPYMTRFTWGTTLAIGFHGIPLRRDGSPIQSDAELGAFRSAGCVRMNHQHAKILFDWSPVGTTVVVTP
jgi:hypothetical protein